MRLQQIDSLRGIAALMVVIYHYFDVVRFGSYGVQLFFIISGFVIALTAGSLTARNFAIRRLFRIFPAYWVSLLCACLVLVITGAPPSARVVLLNITLLQGFVGVENVASPYWTLPLELIFYAVVGLLVATTTLELAPALGGLWLIVATGIRVTVIAGALPYGALADIPLMPNFGQLFIAGFMVGRVVMGRRDPLTYLVLFGAVAFSAFGREDWQSIRPLEYFLTNAMFIGAVWYAGARRPAALSWRPLTLLGGMSYSLYLLHDPVRILTTHFIPELGLMAPVVGIALSFGLAWLCWTLVEQPTIRISRRIARSTATTERQPQATTG